MKYERNACAWAIAASLTTGAVLLPQQVHAQTAGLDEIVVTAQKREERLQDVPISITAVSGEQLENRGIGGVSGLNALAPNLMFRPAAGSNLISVISIRGSVASQPAIWFDPAVGLYLNGVYLGKSQGSVFDLVDVERVEVLRGPQGTLFGRNTEGGAINFISRQPSGEFGGKAGIEYGKFDRKVGRVSMDLPSLGIASASFGFRKEKQDGWAKNRTGPDMGAIDSESVRVSVKLDFSDSVSALYDFDHSKSDNTPPPTSLYATNGWRGTFPSVLGPAFTPFLGATLAQQLMTSIESAITPYVTTKRPSKVSTNGGPIWEKAKNNAHALTLRWQATDMDEVKYIFARRSFDYSDAQDIDGTPLAAITSPIPWGMNAYYHRYTDYEQNSHELQWVGTRDRFRHVLGLYYFKDDGTAHGAQVFSIMGSGAQSYAYTADTDAKAVYAQVDYDITDRWTATVGARYTEEERSGWSYRYNTNGFDGPRTTDVLPLTRYSKEFSETTPMAALAFSLSDDVNLYARVAKGFKSGGFSSEVANPAVAIPYKPQTSVTTEVGVKSTLLDGRARLNFAVYNTDIKDQQFTNLVAGTTQSLVVNTGESTYRGAELEATLLVADGWQVQLGYGYLHTKINKFIDNALNLGPSRPLIDTASNREAAWAPEHTLNLNLDGLLARGGWGELRLILDYSYTAKANLYPVNKNLTDPNAGGAYVAGINTMPSTRNLNARLLLADLPAGPGTVDLSIWAKNLTNEDKMIQSIDFSMFRNAVWQDPRTYMFTATYKW